MKPSMPHLSRSTPEATLPTQGTGDPASPVPQCRPLGGARKRVGRGSSPTGFATLDAELPQGGWPHAALTEILVPRVGHGELNLLGPLLRRLSKSGRTIVLLVPPYLSYAPALIRQNVSLECVKVIRTAQPLDGLAAIESSLQEGEFGALVAVLPEGSGALHSESQVRRLQLAARLADCPAFLFHTCSTPATTSASQLRLLADMSQAGQVRLQRIAPEAGQASVTLEIGSPALARAAFKRLAPQARPVASKAAAGTLGAAPALNDAASREAGHATPERPAQPGAGSPQSKPLPGRSPWPFRQRRSTGHERSAYSAALALFFSRAWNA